MEQNVTSIISSSERSFMYVYFLLHLIPVVQRRMQKNLREAATVQSIGFCSSAGLLRGFKLRVHHRLITVAPRKHRPAVFFGYTGNCQ